MEQNKLKFEDYCLTIEQAKELQALGINMDNCLMEFCSLKDLGDYHLLPKHKYENNFIRWKYIPTLTNTEMLEMLPINITLKGDILSFMIGRDVSNNYYNVVYQCIYADSCCISFNNKLLRDSLFEIIRYLKTNKLM